VAWGRYVNLAYQESYAADVATLRLTLRGQFETDSKGDNC
jgi:hypothetical protein